MSEYCFDDINVGVFGKTNRISDSIEPHEFDAFSEWVKRNLVVRKKEEETMIASGTRVVYLIDTNDFDVEPNSGSKGFTAKKTFTYKDDIDECVTRVTDCDAVLMWDPIHFPGQLTEVFVTGYDVHYEHDNNEITLKLAHAR